jgi:hypothetical protein
MSFHVFLSEIVDIAIYKVGNLRLAADDIAYVGRDITIEMGLKGLDLPGEDLVEASPGYDGAPDLLSLPYTALEGRSIRGAPSRNYKGGRADEGGGFTSPQPQRQETCVTGL